MMKKNLKHAAAIVLLVGFAVFALGSGSSPSSGSSYGSSSGVTYTFSNQSGVTVTVSIEGSTYTIPSGSSRSHSSSNALYVNYSYYPDTVSAYLDSSGFYVTFR